MANTSEFFGTLEFKANRYPWDFVGLGLVYYVLMSQNCKTKLYGFILDEGPAENKGTFIKAIMEKSLIKIEGRGINGTMSALYRFDEWSKQRGEGQKISKGSYHRKRKKLLKLMFKNKWYFNFDYIGEETCKNMFFEKGNADLRVTESYKRKGTGFKMAGLGFEIAASTNERRPHCLYNYSLIVEQKRESEQFLKVISGIMKTMNVKNKYKKFFIDFVKKNKHDKLMNAYNTSPKRDEIPTQVIEGWSRYLKEHSEKGIYLKKRFKKNKKKEVL